MEMTVLACDVQFPERVHPAITRCLLATLLYSCNPSLSPEHLSAHDTTVRREEVTATQQDDTVSASAPTADVKVPS